MPLTGKGRGCPGCGIKGGLSELWMTHVSQLPSGQEAKTRGEDSSKLGAFSSIPGPGTSPELDNLIKRPTAQGVWYWKSWSPAEGWPKVAGSEEWIPLVWHSSACPCCSAGRGNEIPKMCDWRCAPGEGTDNVAFQ